nr:EI24 domain-containing protein [Phaeobacter sp. HF9A]
MSQIGDPRFRRVLLLGIGLAIALLFAATFGVMSLVQWLVGPEATLPLIGPVPWLRNVLAYGTVLMMMVLSVFLMVPVASAMTSIFLDEVADAVEARFYPGLPPVPGLSFWEGVSDSINFLGVMIAANIMALVLYVMLAPAAPFIFWGLNGFLLGREYFTLAAARRLGLAEAKRLRRRHGATIWAAGVLMALPLSVPLVNLVVPILGAATFTHLFHALWQQD